MPTYRLRFARDAYVYGTVEVEAESLEEATTIGERAAGKSGVDLPVRWDDEPVTFDAVVFDGAAPVGEE
jgi:hypothetical protein